MNNLQREMLELWEQLNEEEKEQVLEHARDTVKKRIVKQQKDKKQIPEQSICVLESGKDDRIKNSSVIAERDRTV